MHRRGDVGALIVAVARLVRIGVEVVELVHVAVQIVDELPVAAHQHPPRLDLGVGVARLGGFEIEDVRHQARALHRRRNRHVEERERGRRDVDQLDRRAQHLGRQPDAAAHQEHERHPHLLLVDRAAVIGAAVLAELFAVVGGDHHQRRARELAEAGEQSGDLAIGVGDLAVVARERRRVLGDPVVGDVGLVRIEVVGPEKGARLAAGVELRDPRQDLVGERVGVDGAGVGPLEAEVRGGVGRELAPSVEEQARGVPRGGVPAARAQRSRSDGAAPGRPT